MKKVFTRLLLLGIVAFTVYACDNGNADVTVLSSAPDVSLTNVPAGVVSGTDIKVAVDVSDGAFESTSLSPIATVNYVISDTVSLDVIASGTISGSGRAVSDSLTIETDTLAASTYKVEVVATDTEGLSTSAEAFFFVAEDFSIGLIGSATPEGWDADTDMERGGANFDSWTLNVTLTGGAAKFRKNDAWDENWGGNEFPAGTGVFNGPDISVDPGDYTVTFNSTTLAYNFIKLSGPPPTPIGIIGTATPGGWDADTDLQKVEGTDNTWSLTLDLVEGEAKFRKDNAWDDDWGGDAFPSSDAIYKGANIQVSPGGRYKVTLDLTANTYNFELQ